MTGGFTFWDTQTWSFIVTLSILFGAMLLANLLRRKIRFLRYTLLPSSVLGGFLVLIADLVYKRIFGRSMFELFVLEALTYHGLGLGFIALAWRHLEGVRGKKARRDVFHTATVTVGGYLIQAVVGLAITVVLFYLLGSFAAGGILLPMGYGQGPGQAFNWGSTYENGGLFLSDRYTTSNAVYQMTKLPSEKWDGYLEWLKDYEYRLLELPSPDVVIYLDMPPQVSQRLMSGRYSGDESKKDIHEANISFQEQCRRSALYAAQRLGWTVIGCSHGENPRSIEEISDEIWGAVRGSLI